MVPMLLGKDKILPVLLKNQSTVVEMMSQFVKGAQDLRSLQKRKGAIRLFKGVTAQSYKLEVKKTMMQHCIGVVGTVIETGAYIVVLIIGAQKIMGRNGSWFTCCSFSDNRDALFSLSAMWEIY